MRHPSLEEREPWSQSKALFVALLISIGLMWGLYGIGEIVNEPDVCSPTSKNPQSGYYCGPGVLAWVLVATWVLGFCAVLLYCAGKTEQRK